MEFQMVFHGFFTSAFLCCRLKGRFFSILDQTLQRFKQRLGLYGIAQMCVEPGLHAALDVLVKGVGGQGDDGDRPVFRRQDPAESRSVNRLRQQLWI
jgi:hypothetical protein